MPCLVCLKAQVLAFLRCDLHDLLNFSKQHCWNEKTSHHLCRCSWMNITSPDTPRLLHLLFYQIDTYKQTCIWAQKTLPRLGPVIETNFRWLVSRFPDWFPLKIRLAIKPLWVFPKIGVPQNGWFIMEIPIKMNALGVPSFSETSLYLGVRGTLRGGG